MKKKNRMVNKSKKVKTVLKCSECGKPFVIWRLRCRQKKEGHIKDIWCPFCQKDVKFIETKRCENTLSGESIAELF